jgi:hypothetical protein
VKSGSTADVCAVQRSTHLQSGFFVVFPDSCHSLVPSGILRYTNSLTTSKFLSPIATLCSTSRIVLSCRAAIIFFVFSSFIFNLTLAASIPMLSKHPERLTACALVQTACSALKFFFDMAGLTISAVKSEAMVFSRKHHKPDVTLCIYGRSMPQTKEFKYLGVFFDSGLRWSTQVRYVQRRCLQRLNFMRLIAGT